MISSAERSASAERTTSREPPLEYPSRAVSLAHPARLAGAAALHGVGGFDLVAFRYLELGAGNGANLLPLAAAFPGARFVGVDRDGALVTRARAAAERAALGNVTFVEGDIAEVDLGDDTFDFVVAHGVYSWVEDAVASRILALAARHLDARGVAYVSYNTLPGWALRGVVRDVMRDAAGGASRPEERLRLAKSRVALLQRFTSRGKDPYTALLAGELEGARDKPDGYLVGEHLADVNRPLYFKAFIAAARAHGLAYVAELMPATAEGALETELASELDAEGLPRLEIEQILDVVAYRQFRCTLLCKEGVAVASQPDFAGLAREGFLVARLQPMAEEPLLGPGRELRFQARTGAEIAVERPLLKAALLALARAFPGGARPQALVAAAVAELRERGLVDAAGIDEAEISSTMSDLLLLAGRRLIEILPWAPAVHRAIEPKPRVSEVTRIEAATGLVTLPLNEPHVLDEPLRSLVALLDGTRDARALLDELSMRIDSGELTVVGHPSPRERREALGRLVVQAIAELAALGLLLPGAPPPPTGAATP